MKKKSVSQNWDGKESQASFLCKDYNCTSITRDEAQGQKNNIPADARSTALDYHSPKKPEKLWSTTPPHCASVDIA